MKLLYILHKTRKLIYLPLISLALCLLPYRTASPYEPVVEWEKTFGGTDGDYGYSVQQTTDGGYIICGLTDSYGAGYYDVYLVKIDTAGNMHWSKTFGGTNLDWGRSVQQTSDEGYIICGGTDSYGAGSADIYLIKTDISGNAQWEKIFGGSRGDFGYSVQQTSDGGYIICGHTYSYGAGSYDVYLIKTDTAGNAEWQNTFGGSYDDWGFSVQQTSNGGYIICGSTYSYGAGSADVYLIKTDNAGNMQWSKTYGGTDYDSGYSARQTSDGGYIISGVTKSPGVGNYDVYLIKTDSSGNSQWEKTFGGGSYDYGESVRQTSDGGYIVCGWTDSYSPGDYDVYLIKTDSSGNAQWSKTFGGSSNEESYSVQQTIDGGYIICGSTNSYGAGSADVYLIKVATDLYITSIEMAGNDVTLYWNARPGISYTVQYSTDIENWTDVLVGETDHWTDYSVPETKKFYRVQE